MHLSVPLAFPLILPLLPYTTGKPIATSGDHKQSGVLGPLSLLLSSRSETASDPTDSPLQKRIVWNPKISNPTGNTRWVAGRTEQVTWETTDQPPVLHNATGTILLGYKPKNGQGGLNLEWTLADSVPLSAGHQAVTLPTDLTARRDYIIVVMGDSGNASPLFRIEAASA